MIRQNKPIFSLLDLLEQVQVNPGVLQNRTFEEFEQRRTDPFSNQPGSNAFSNFMSIQDSQLPRLPNFGSSADDDPSEDPSVPSLSGGLGNFGDFQHPPMATLH